MRSGSLGAFAVIGALCCGTPSLFAQTPPSLGSAASFAVLGSRVSNTGNTILAGNAGGGGVAGLSRSNFVLGEVRSNDALARQAQSDSAAAYAALAALPCSQELATLSGKLELSPGCYRVSSAIVTDSLILKPGVNPDASWIFQIDQSLTTSPLSTIQTVDGGRDNRVFWRVGGSVSLGATSTFVGNVLARGDITLGRDANVSGRLLSQGAVTLDDSAVTICCDLLDMTPHLLPNGTVGVSYTHPLTAVGGKPPYTFAKAAGELPPGVTFSSGSFTGTPTTKGVYQVAIVVTDLDGFNCIRVYTIVICETITLPPIPPTPCTPFETTITPSGGTLPYTFTSTALPPGFTLSSSGVLRGTFAPGPYDFFLNVTDALGCTGSREYKGTVTGSLTLKPETDRLPEGAVGVEYTVPFEVAGGAGPFTFEISGEPSGLEKREVTAAGFTLKGIPKESGCYRLTVTATNGVCTITKTYDIVICDVPVTFTPDVLLPGDICTPYDGKITAAGCTGPYAYSLLIPGSLPPGLELDSVTGKIFGQPSKPGNYCFTIVAKGALGCTARRDYCIEIVCQPIMMDTQLLDAPACEPYSHQFTVTSCAGSCEFSPDPQTPLPAGLTLDKGLLSGTPALPGNYTFNVIVTCDGCPPVVFSVSLKVICNIKIFPSRLPDGFLGIGYDNNLTACGGTPTYTFSVTAGGLPPGLALSPDGNITGIPGALGCFNFTVRATDSVGCFSEQTYVICIVTPSVGAPLSEWMMLTLAIALGVLGFVILRKIGS